MALRRLERTVRASRHSVPAEPTAFWEFLGRVLQPRMAGAGHGVPLTDATITHAVSADGPPEPPRIILP